MTRKTDNIVKGFYGGKTKQVREVTGRVEFHSVRFYPVFGVFSSYFGLPMLKCLRILAIT